MMILIRPRPLLITKKRTLGVFDYLFIIPLEILKFFFKEYGVIAAAMILVILGGVIAFTASGNHNFQEVSWELLRDIGELVGLLILIFFRLFHLFISSNKKDRF
jgi:hypothetical protein